MRRTWFCLGITVFAALLASWTTPGRAEEKLIFCDEFQIRPPGYWEGCDDCCEDFLGYIQEVLKVKEFDSGKLRTAATSLWICSGVKPSSIPMGSLPTYVTGWQVLQKDYEKWREYYLCCEEKKKRLNVEEPKVVVDPWQEWIREVAVAEDKDVAEMSPEDRKSDFEKLVADESDGGPSGGKPIERETGGSTETDWQRFERRMREDLRKLGLERLLTDQQPSESLSGKPSERETGKTSGLIPVDCQDREVEMFYYAWVADRKSGLGKICSASKGVNVVHVQDLIDPKSGTNYKILKPLKVFSDGMPAEFSFALANSTFLESYLITVSPKPKNGDSCRVTVEVVPLAATVDTLESLLEALKGNE